MTAVTFLWFVGVLALVPMAEARLLRSQNRVVWSELPSSGLQKMVKNLQGMLRKIPRTVVDPLFIMNMANITISSLEVPDWLFRVHEIESNPAPSSVFIRVSITVPKVHVTFSSKACNQPETDTRPCQVLYNFEDVRVGLRTEWQINRQLTKISRAEITSAVPGSIKARIQIGHRMSSERAISREDLGWYRVIARVKSHIPDRNPNYQELVRTFAGAVFL